MTKKEAKKMLDSLLNCQRALDSALIYAQALEIEKERHAIKKVLADVIGEILTEAIMPITAQHPELDPYK